MTLLEIIQSLGLPVAYGYHTEKQPLPYFVLMGAGQDHFEADGTYYVTKDRTQIEYYFKRKDGALEKRLETLLLDNGILYEKSEDVYIDDEGVFVIYYDV